MQSSTYCADAVRNSYTLYILDLGSAVLKFQSLLCSTEITDTARARLQTVIEQTQAELRDLP
jgi:hypothetical protein